MKNNFGHIRFVYLIGIGGIGMSALARYFRHAGKTVYGYDRVRSRLTDELEQEGIGITTENTAAGIPEAIKNATPEEVTVVYTAAIHRPHQQLDWFIGKGYQTGKRAEVLGAIARDYQVIAVGGTHGKTTTSCLIASLLAGSGISFMAILGGISTDLRSNFYVQGDQPEYLVTEADEFDGSFHHLQPLVTVLTSTDPDHLDFYKTEKNIKQAFVQFAASTRPEGLLIRQEGCDVSTGEIKARTVDYGIGRGTAAALNLEVKDQFYFDYRYNDITMPHIHCGVKGVHNVENSVGALTAATELGADERSLAAALARFKGVRRRFEFVIERDDQVYIDDYAHHPTELTSTIQSVRQLYPGRTITGIFQPHLFSRTRDFADEFARCLSELDHTILMPVYPAREEPIPGVNTAMIAAKMTGEYTLVNSPDEVIDHVSRHKPELLLTLGAGDIDRIVEPLKDILT